MEKTGQTASGDVQTRAEMVAEKPLFRSTFKTRRCMIPALGFYDHDPGANKARCLQLKTNSRHQSIARW
jgi:putative SOS response-associated peptidase YedK